MRISSDNKNITIDNLNEKKLYLKVNNDYLELNKNDETFILTIESLKKHIKTENTPCFFVNEKNEVIDVSKIKTRIIFANESYLDYKNDCYYIYIDKHDKLSLVYKTKPSVFNFYKKDCEFVETNKNKEFIYQFTCKYFKPSTVNTHIKKRNKDFEVVFKANHFNVIEKENNEYQVTVINVIEGKELEELVSNAQDITNYNVEAYDLHFSYEIEEMPISNYAPRIKGNSSNILDENDEIWGVFDDINMMLLKIYFTDHGNLSCRLFLVPKLTYSYYLKMKQINVQTQQKSKPTIICCEYPEKAQDNGYVFFKYLIKNYADNFNIYYLISDNSKDIKNLNGYERNLIQYKSVEHIKLFEKADLIIHSHTPNYALPFFTNFLENKVKEKNKLFLQHGVIASKDVSHIYGRKPTNEFTNLFVVSSEREKKEVFEKYNYPLEDIILTGLPRFDTIMENKGLKDTVKNSVLIMPTWRKGLDQYSEKAFKETDFYKIYASLIHNKDLIDLITRFDYTVKLYLHKNLQKFSYLFEGKFINVMFEGEKTVSELLKESSLLITDYSSVGFDFALMEKKVLYYRPPELISEEMIEENNNVLPGNIIDNEKKLIENMNSFDMDKIYKNKLKDIYKYNDSNACNRIALEVFKILNRN